eukprot:CAMPEP_0204325484 /NCGR_PEP_ID=MMETSP0469-20131031/11060_1 /ASSEMBLY_ACC=CAM_ASM_000384 /TAXON_ID=2969 /ORGANISM="Oxyrrhis marina" /LENGTH=50 /DNA_ID=CAMNT_0051307347 /DNA_START=66 /DNA_END=218 /DNA_ORIENTATION=-
MAARCDALARDTRTSPPQVVSESNTKSRRLPQCPRWSLSSAWLQGAVPAV